MTATSRINRVPAAERGITIGDFLVPIMIWERIGVRSRHLVLILTGALFIALTANISIRVPDSPVPITGQTFAVLLVGGSLGMRRGALASLLYLALGFVGLPVFAEHASGIAKVAAVVDGQLVLGATGGYLIGFVLAAGLVGRLAELGWDRHIGGSAAAMALGNVVIYLVGIPWLMAALGVPVGRAIELGFIPYVLGDLLKLALAAGVFPAAWWVVGRRSEDR